MIKFCHKDIFFTVIGGGLLGGVIGIVLFLMTSAVIEKHWGFRADDPSRAIEIVSLSNGTETEGSFVLGNGTVNGVEYYYYFRHNGEGFVRGKIPVYNSVIIEDEIEQPVIRVETTHIPEWADSWAESLKPEPYNRIYVPHGTVVQQFSVH